MNPPKSVAHAASALLDRIFAISDEGRIVAGAGVRRAAKREAAYRAAQVERLKGQGDQAYTRQQRRRDERTASKAVRSEMTNKMLGMKLDQRRRYLDAMDGGAA